LIDTLSELRRDNLEYGKQRRDHQSGGRGEDSPAEIGDGRAILDVLPE
jgi:hypothetical protein